MSRCTEPVAVEPDCDEGGRDGEVIDERVNFEKEIQFVSCRHKLKWKVHAFIDIHSLSFNVHV